MNTERITFEEAKSRLVSFKNLFHTLEKTVIRRKHYKEKKAEVSKNAKLFFEGQDLLVKKFIVKFIVKMMMMMMVMMMMVMMEFTLQKEY